MDHKKWEETHDDVDAPTLDEKDWPRTIEAIEEWFRGCLGDSSNSHWLMSSGLMRALL